MQYIKLAGFYLLVAIIILVAVFPFYYAIITSVKSGTALFQVDYWPTNFSIENYTSVLTQGGFLRSLGNSLLVATVVVAFSLLLAVTAAYALARVSFRGRGLCCSPFFRCRCFPRLRCWAGCSN
jgi:trehalose/maltose transport system permease protein